MLANRKNYLRKAKTYLPRLEYLQVISLVTQDDFLSQFNVSIPTDRFIDRLSDFVNFHDNNFYKIGFNVEDKGNWTNQYKVNYTQVIGRRGLCFTFNFPTSRNFFNVADLSSDFNYNKTISTFTTSHQPETMNFEHPLRTSNAELGMNVQLRKERMHIRTDKNDDFIPMNSENGFHLTFNDPFEILSEDSPNFFAVFNRTTSFTINPKKFNFDDSISIYSSEQ